MVSLASPNGPPFLALLAMPITFAQVLIIPETGVFLAMRRSQVRLNRALMPAWDWVLSLRGSLPGIQAPTPGSDAKTATVDRPRLLYLATMQHLPKSSVRSC